METVYRDFRDQVEFFYVYKALAHPEKDGLIQPLVMEERLSHIARAKEQLGTEIPWLADPMTNDLKHAFGDRNNSEFVISPDGKVLIARAWSNPEELRSNLEELVGKPSTTTQIADLTLPRSGIADEGEAVARGVVERIPRPSGSEPLMVTAVSEDDSPLYLKLRAEAPRTVGQGKDGQVHLAFYMDPIHHVHWNNLAAPMKLAITPSEGLTIDPASAEAQTVTVAEADLDPREFLLSVSQEGASENSFLVTVDYFACDDDNRWCKAVTQTFEVTLAFNRDAGRVQNRGSSFSKGKAKGPGPAGPGKGKGSLEPAEILARMDSNEDEEISRTEARGPLARLFDEIDTDKDGSLSKLEIRTHFANR